MAEFPTIKDTPKNLAKMAAGKLAASLVEDRMLVGLGTGSTAAYFIDFLIARCQSENLRVSGLATSERSAKQALSGGIALLDPLSVTTLDLNVDGADEIDLQKRMIKGGGGALLREKIVASTSIKKVVIVDRAKVVPELGSFPLPVEVIPFAYLSTLNKIKALQAESYLRKTKDGKVYVTDNGNYIIDIHFQNKCNNPEELAAELKKIPGVLETGFFFNLADSVIVGEPDGTAKIYDDLNT